MFEFAIATASTANAVDEKNSNNLRKHWDDGEVVETLVLSLCLAILTAGMIPPGQH